MNRKKSHFIFTGSPLATSTRSWNQQFINIFIFYLIILNAFYRLSTQNPTLTGLSYRTHFFVLHIVLLNKAKLRARVGGPQTDKLISLLAVPMRHLCFGSSWLFNVLLFAMSATDILFCELKVSPVTTYMGNRAVHLAAAVVFADGD